MAFTLPVDKLERLKPRPAPPAPEPRRGFSRPQSSSEEMAQGRAEVSRIRAGGTAQPEPLAPIGNGFGRTAGRFDAPPGPALAPVPSLEDYITAVGGIGGGPMKIGRAIGTAVGGIAAPAIVDRLLPDNTPGWLRGVADAGASVAGAVVGHKAAPGVARGARAVNAAGDTAAMRTAAPEAFQRGRAPGEDLLATYGPHGEPLGRPTGGVYELGLGQWSGGAEKLTPAGEALLDGPNLRARPAGGNADQSLPPITEAEVNAIKAKIAREGMTPENRAAIDDAMGRLFHPDYNASPTSHPTSADIGKNLQRARNAEARAVRMAEPTPLEPTPTDPFARFDYQQPQANPSEIAPDRAAEIRRLAIERANRARPAGLFGTDTPRPPLLPPINSQTVFESMKPPEVQRATVEVINDILATPLSALSTYDQSAPGRQLFKVLLAHPTAIGPVFRAQTRALRSEEAFQASQQALRERPWARLRDLMGVEMGEVGGDIAKREESIQSTYAERLLPKAKRFNASYTAAINEARDFMTKLAIDKMPRELMTEEGMRNGGLAELRRRGRLINAATGRGNLGEAFKDSKVLGQPLFWAIRMRVGNAQVPLSMVSSKSGWVRAEAARETASLVAFNAALFAIGKATGVWDVEVDPRSSDWGMVRIGNRRWDFTAGMRPLVNLIARSGVTAFNSATGGDTSNAKTINTPDGPGNLYDRKMISVVGNYFRSALSPTLGEVWTQLEGKDIVGNKVEHGLKGRSLHALQGLGAALFLQQVAEELAYTVPQGYEEGGKQGAAVEAGKTLASAVPYYFGVGGGYYEPKDEGSVPARRSPLRPARPSGFSRPRPAGLRR